MVNEVPQVSLNVRKFMQNRLESDSKFRQISSQFYRTYCNIVGPFHCLPDYFILGAQKAGTTSLHNYLLQHPNIHHALSKDIRFFDKYYDKGINWYKTYFPWNFQKSFHTNILRKKFLCGDGTERYLDHPHAPLRLKKFIPNSKFIIILRNPIDRAFSHYTMIRERGQETLSFEDAISNESKRLDKIYNRMLNEKDFYDDDYFYFGYASRGIYVDKLLRWMNVFSRDQFLVITTEELSKNTSEVYDEVINFLGLPNWKLKKFNRYKQSKSTNQTINPNTRKELSDFFKPHNERLYKFLDKDLGWG